MIWKGRWKTVCSRKVMNPPSITHKSCGDWTPSAKPSSARGNNNTEKFLIIWSTASLLFCLFSYKVFSTYKCTMKWRQPWNSILGCASSHLDAWQLMTCFKMYSNNPWYWWWHAATECHIAHATKGEISAWDPWWLLITRWLADEESSIKPFVVTYDLITYTKYSPSVSRWSWCKLILQQI